MTSPDEYPAGSPERLEWLAIADQNAQAAIQLEERFRTLGWDAAADDAAEVMNLDGLERVRRPDAPRGMGAAGWLLFPDVSEHQGAFDWAACRAAGIRIGCYKVSEGRTYLDGQQARNASAIRAAGLVGMAYHFVYWSAEYDSDPSLWNAQGRFFAQHVPADYAHAIDVEMRCGGVSTNVARVVAGYREVYPDHPLMIYTNRGLWGISKGTPDPSTLGLIEWHAGIADGRYTSATGTLAAQWSGTSGLSNSMTGMVPKVWQFTDHASVAGQLVDGNAYQGTVDQFVAEMIGGDDMSQADVDALKAYIDSKVPAIAQAVLQTPFQTWDGPRSLAYITSRAYYVGTQAQTQTDTLEASAATQTAALGQLSTAAMAAAVMDGLRANLGEIVVDYDRLGVIVQDKLDEHLGTLRIVSDAPLGEQPSPPTQNG